MTEPWNPYDPEKPVGPQEFAGRASQIEEIRGAFATVKGGRPVKIFMQGEWGIGKTSLVLKLCREFQEHAVIVREDVLDGPAPAQREAFYAAILRKLTDTIEADIADTGEIVCPFDEDSSDLPVTNIDYERPYSFREHIRRLISIVWNRKKMITMIVLDNLERAKPEFLSGLKDVFQRIGEDTPYLLVCAGRSLPGAGEDAADPIARFFRPVPVDRMTEEEAHDAIQKPLQYHTFTSFRFTDEAIPWIQYRADGHPYFLKLICFLVFEIAKGTGDIGREWLDDHWDEIEDRLGKIRFSGAFEPLPEAESQTLLSACLCGLEFERSYISDIKGSTLDTALRRLTKERELLHQVSRGVYRFYHPLFHAFVRSRAKELGFTVMSEQERELHELIKQGEGQHLEFKETLEYDTIQEAKNSKLVEPVLKTIAAFHNASGGTLLIGVADDGTVKGIERDLKLDLKLWSEKQRSRDGFKRKIENLVRDRLTPKQLNRVEIRFASCEGKDVCIVEVPKLPDITYFKNKDENILYHRDGSSSEPIDPGEQMEKFIKDRKVD